MPSLLSVNIADSIKPLIDLMTDKNMKLATAESCTGGMLSQWCTSVDGSSRWFECGFVTYSNASKIKLLGVQLKVLDEYGAVSQQVAEQMALGVLTHSDADVSVSITGIAGPGGGSEAKPVGTVYIATAGLSQRVDARHYLFEGNRQEIRQKTSFAAIQHLVEYLS